MGVGDFKVVVNMERQKEQQQVKVESVQRFVESESKKNKCTKQFKFKSLH